MLAQANQSVRAWPRHCHAHGLRESALAPTHVPPALIVPDRVRYGVMSMALAVGIPTSYGPYLVARDLLIAVPHCHQIDTISMSASTRPTQALWLDPFRVLGAYALAQLRALGVEAQVINTLDELQAGIASAQLIVLGLGAEAELLQDIRARNETHRHPIVCRIERRNLEGAVAAMQGGACHVLAADDFSTAAWQAALRSAATHQATAAHATTPPPDHPLPQTATMTDVAAVRSVVYVDPVSRNLLALAQRVAQANVTVLLEGPTGSGKEVLARVLHESSSAAPGPFIGLNCAALPEHMIEDMLFGHEKGAFTGAIKEHRGLFEQAQGGTLFLDEIGEMPLPLQAKLLRVLQERTLVRLGAERSIALNVRVIAATNKDLRQAITQREFREDLYFRLSTFKLRVPPLRERLGDIMPLVARLLARHCVGAQAWRISPQAQAMLLAYAWPGNVRELENVVQRAVVLCTDQTIDVAQLMFDDAPLTNLPTQPFEAPMHKRLTPTAELSDSLPSAALLVHPLEPGQCLQAAVKHSEQHVIRAAIETSESRIEAAKKLGISPRTLRYKLARLRDDAHCLPVTL